MIVDGISPFMSTESTNSTSSSNNSNEYLSMDDFYELLVAQLSNQDMNNTVDNTEFISQMSQFSMIQAISDLTQQSTTANSINLIGKGATVLQNDSNGNSQMIMGVVQGVNIQNGKANIVIEGKSYSMSSVTEVFDASLIGGE